MFIVVAGDGLTDGSGTITPCTAQGMAFSTFDADHDTFGLGNVAAIFRGAWWYNWGHLANPNGAYLGGSHPLSFGDGIEWFHWTGYQYSLKFMEMKISVV